MAMRQPSLLPNRQTGKSVNRDEDHKGLRTAGIRGLSSPASPANPQKTPAIPASAARRLGQREWLAEEVGFEPTVDFHPRRFSRPVH
jgi:hypothetical protein